MFVACDESGTDSTTPFFVLGTVWVRKDDLIQFETEIIRLRLQKKCWGEIEWNKIGGQSTSSSVIDFYKNFLYLAFTKIPFSFHCIVVKKSLLNLRTYHSNNMDLAKFKFFRLIIGKFGQKLPQNLRKKIFILYDQFNETKASRENQWARKMRDTIENDIGSPLEHIQPCDSHICSLIQFCDLLTGAVGAVWNGRLKTGHPKAEIVDFIEKNTKIKLNIATLPTATKYNIWLWRPFNK
jgi:hypothetical protein